MSKMVKAMELLLNPDNKWVKSSRLRRRLEGFGVYLFLSFASLFEPEAVDMVLYKILKGQFIEVQEKGEGDGAAI